VFLVIRMVPGDPVAAMLGPNAEPEQIEAMRAELGLNRSVFLQYLMFLQDVGQGSLGNSILSRKAVSTTIMENVPHTFILAGFGLTLALALGVFLGVSTSVRLNRWSDQFIRVMGLIGVSIPDFYFGMLMILVFSYQLHWFPLSGGGQAGNMGSLLLHATLPALTLGLSIAAVIMRITRSCMLDVLGAEYVRTAKAKGLRDTVVIYKHALRNALIPLVTVAGGTLARLLGGAVVLESVFSRPGLGQLLVNAVNTRDFPVVQGTSLVFAVIVVVVNFAVDVSYAYLDPRVHYA